MHDALRGLRRKLVGRVAEKHQIWVFDLQTRPSRPIRRLICRAQLLRALAEVYCPH